MQWQGIEGYGVLWIIINFRVLGVLSDRGLLCNALGREAFRRIPAEYN